VAQCGGDEGVANVSICRRNHALNTPRNHLTHSDRAPSHHSIDDVASRHNDLRLVRAALKIVNQPLGPRLCNRHHLSSLQA
ncbi:hypothetical protein A2U01_0053865, partial [Trifolium medium]|nr:hypothetical protein [Trifolium medium]